MSNFRPDDAIKQFLYRVCERGFTPGSCLAITLLKYFVTGLPERRTLYGDLFKLLVGFFDILALLW